MAESPTEIIRRTITTVLPDFSEELIHSLIDALKEVGVETLDDMRYVTEGDLVPTLNPIQARRLVTWAKNAYASPPPSHVVSCSPSPSPTSSVTSLSSPCNTPSSSVNWSEKFEIPWAKLPEELMQCLERQKRPAPKLRREMIRVVVAAVIKVCNSPTKPHMAQIAKRMVAKYPKSLQDVIDGDIVGSGYDSIAKQLQTRLENVKRPDTPKIKRRKQDTEEEDTDELTPSQRATVQDTYGCVKWDPKFMPVAETVESQKMKKEQMKKMHEDMNYNAEEIKALVVATYFSQRGDINKGVPLKRLRQEWPFLFKEPGMAAHFEELTGLSLIGTFIGNVERKGRRLLEFFRHVVAPKNKKVQDVLMKCHDEEPSGSCTGTIEMIILLMTHFAEKDESLFHFVDDTCLAQEIDREKLPPNPCIIVCGSSCFAAKIFMLAIDQEVVNDHISTFMMAVCLMFGSYYVFNIHYPVELRSSLEFLQRCFFGINPERGTKVEWKKQKKVLPVNPRVLTLISDLADYEWK